MDQGKITLSDLEKQAIEKLRRWIRYWEKYTFDTAVARAKCAYRTLHQYEPDWEKPLKDLAPQKWEDAHFSKEQLNSFNHLKYCRWCLTSLPKNALIGFLTYYVAVELVPKERNALLSKKVKEYLIQHSLL